MDPSFGFSGDASRGTSASSTPFMSRRSSWSTTSGFVPGPGATTGKALVAFGNAALRYTEEIVIRRRLSSIKKQFPHSDTDTLQDADKLYKDVLELARPGFYRERFRRQALALLLTQISARNTGHLLESLDANIHPIETPMLLEEMILCLPHEWLDFNAKREPMHQDLQTVYLNAQSAHERHAAAPFIDFVRQFAQTGTKARQVIFDAGFLDVVLTLSICDFAYPHCCDVSANAPQSSRETLMEACTTALDALFVDDSVRALAHVHPLGAFWPGAAVMEEASLDERRSVWRSLLSRRFLVKERIKVIDTILSGFASFGGSLFNACADLVEFSRYDSYGVQIEEWALSYLLRWIALGLAHWRILTSALSRTPYHQTVDILFRLVDSLVPFTTRKSVLSLQIYLHDFSRAGDIDPVNNFIEFSIVAAAHSRTLRAALLDAGIIVLLLPCLEPELREPADFPGAFQFDDSRSSLSAQSHEDTLRLVLLMREYGLASLLKDEAQSADPSKRQLCCRAFYTLLGNGGHAHEELEETQAVLRKVLGWKSVPSTSSSLTRAIMDI